MGWDGCESAFKEAQGHVWDLLYSTMFAQIGTQLTKAWHDLSAPMRVWNPRDTWSQFSCRCPWAGGQELRERQERWVCNDASKGPLTRTGSALVSGPVPGGCFEELYTS